MRSSTIEVEAALLGEPEPVGAVEDDLDRVVLGLEAALERRGELLVVLDHKQLHVRIRMTRPG